jgi:WD40 repeat protein
MIFTRWTIIAFLFCILKLCSGCSNEKEQLMVAKSSYRFNEGTVLAVDLSKNGTISAILTADQQISVWHNRTHHLIAQWNKQQLEEEVFHLALSGDRRLLAVGGHWTVTLLNIEDSTVVTSWDVQGFTHSATVSALDVDESANRVLVGMSDGAVLSVNLKSGNALKLDNHTARVTRLGYDASGQYAFSGAIDKKLARWHTGTGELVWQHEFRSRVTTLAFDPAAAKLFVSDALTSHWIVDSASGEKITELNYFERFRYFRQAMFVQQSNYLITSSPKQTMTLWDSASGDELKSWNIAAYTANTTVLAMAKPDNKTSELLTLSADAVLQVWDYQLFINSPIKK